MCDLTKPHFQDADKAREYLEELRWGGQPVCPHCGSDDRVYTMKGGRDGLYKCGDCRKQFTVTVGTVFESSRVPLNKWLIATYLMASSKKGISAKQLERTLGVTYKTAWFMAHRIREAMKEDDNSPVGGEGKTVEVDETYFGHDKTIKPKRQRKGRGYQHKYKVLSLVERESGKVRSVHVNAVNAKTLRPILDQQIAKDAVVYTDEAPVYTLTRPAMFQNHDYVSHGVSEYVRGDVHTNTIEGYFSIFKRGMNGIYQHCSKEHLKRYLCEYDFRYNYREKLGYDDPARFDMMLKGIQGKRLTYNRPYC